MEGRGEGGTKVGDACNIMTVHVEKVEICQRMSLFPPPLPKASLSTVYSSFLLSLVLGLDPDTFAHTQDLLFYVTKISAALNLIPIRGTPRSLIRTSHLVFWFSIIAYFRVTCGMDY